LAVGNFAGFATNRDSAKNRDKVAFVAPLDELFKWLPAADFAVLEHRFEKHGRDYILLVEDCLGTNPGQHEIVFTHCVKAACETRVRDEVWLKSWSDAFTDYQRWTDAGEPDGYVWGTNWSLAYPGFQAVPDSAQAAEWSRRLGKEMFETTLQADRFFLRLVFHSIHSRKTSEKHETISRLIHRLRATFN
jgi:hypothetical protein